MLVLRVLREVVKAWNNAEKLTRSKVGQHASAHQKEFIRDRKRIRFDNSIGELAHTVGLDLGFDTKGNIRELVHTFMTSSGHDVKKIRQNIRKGKARPV